MRSRGSLRLPLLLLVALRACAVARHEEGAEDSHAGSPGGHRGTSAHWSYADKAKWASNFSSCGGHMQSPINIDTATTIPSPQLKPLLLSGYDVPPEEELSLRNNGHTIVLDLPGNLTLSGGAFPEPYRAAQLHLHWGSTAGQPGSEHTVDGLRYAGEMHMVHYNPRFGSIREAARQPGGLAVLAAFLQVGSEENEPYQHILEHLNDVHEEGDVTRLAGFDIAKLLPDHPERYFRYNGSLTTPPCYQTVNWTIFNETIELSQEQVLVLERSLQGDDDEHLESNFRLPQSLNGRRVLASFPLPHTPPSAQPPDESESPTETPFPYVPTEGGDEPVPGKDEEHEASPADAGTGGDLASASKKGQDHSLGAGAEKQLDSTLRTGDVLAVLFGTLFGVTALAFLYYVHKHRSQNQRLDAQAAKSGVMYTAATTEENPV